MEEKGKLKETEEFKALKRMGGSVWDLVKQVKTVPVGVAGLLFFVVALVAAFNNMYGAVLALGFGFWFIIKAKKELKAKEETK